MGGEWQPLTLKEAGVSLIDCVHKTPPDAGDGYPYIAIPQMKGGQIDLAGVRRISQKHFDEWTKKADPKGFDIILSRRCNPGTTAYVPPGFKFALGQNLVLLRADGEKVFPPFLRWLVCGPEWWGQISKFINVGAVFDSLRCADVPKFTLTIPSFDDQKRIAGVLGALDDKIELNRKMNKTLEAMAQAIFKSWFVDFEPFRDDGMVDSELGPIPKGWEVGKLGNIISIHDSKRIPLSKKQRSERLGHFPYYGATSIMDYVDDYLFEGIYVLLGEDGSVVDEQDHPVVQYVWGKFWVNNHAHVLLPEKPFCVEWLICFLRGLNIRPFITGAVQLKLNQGNLKRIPVIVPPEAVCRQFNDHAQSLYSKYRANADEILTLIQLRDILLPKLISGEVRVPDVEQLVAETA